MPTILALPDAGAVQTTDSLILEQSGGTKKVPALTLATAFFSEMGGESAVHAAATYEPIVHAAATYTAISDLADSANVAKGDALVAVNNGDTNEVPRTLHYWIKASRRNLCNFLSTAEVDDILSNTGSIDVSTKFQNALSAASGSFLDLPAGTIRADNLTVAGTRSVVSGLGYATKILSPSATNNVFTVSGDFAELRDLAIFASVARTGAARYVDVQSTANRFRLQDFLFDGCKNGIRIAVTATATIQGGEILNFVAASSTLIEIDSGLDITISDVLTSAAAQAFAGIYLKNCGDVTLNDNQILQAGQALYLNPGAGQSVVSVKATGGYYDSSTRGLFADAAGGSVYRCVFNGAWFGNASSQGVLLQSSAGGSVNGMYFNGCEIVINGADGLLAADSGVSNVHILGGHMAQNVGAGLSFSTNVNSFSVIGARVGAEGGFTANAQGISISAGTSTNYRIVGNDLTGNTGAGLVDGGSGTKVVSNNNGDVTRAGGADNVAIGTAAKVIAHGLSGTPAAGDINVVPTQSMVASGIGAYWISTIGASNFTVNTNVNVAGAAFSFGWNASIKGA